MKKIIWLSLFSVLLLLAENTTAQSFATISSPDKSITATVQLKEGRISYTIKKNGITVIEPSSLGITMSDADFSKELKLISVSKPALVIDSYETLTAKRKISSTKQPK
ncbi:MAG: glycoside hydrolase family 97 N-terminal domain-containing protein [Lacibacter sp.]